jgi:hypothetical protein
MIQAFTATLIAGSLSSELADVALWQRAGLAALTGLITLGHRLSESWLVSHPADWSGPLTGADE